MGFRGPKAHRNSTLNHHFRERNRDREGAQEALTLTDRPEPQTETEFAPQYVIRLPGRPLQEIGEIGDGTHVIGSLSHFGRNPAMSPFFLEPEARKCGELLVAEGDDGVEFSSFASGPDAEKEPNSHRNDDAGDGRPGWHFGG